MACDHNKVTTRFCPDCGASMATNPLCSLLRHVRIHAGIQRTRAEQTGYASRKNVAALWESWASALAEVIDAKDNPETK